MTIENPTAAPTEPVAPAAPAAAAPVTPPAEPAPLHPAWEQALEAIPDMLRPKIVDQIRKSDTEAQRAIEAARGTIDPEWQKFLTAAQAAGATPEEMRQGWNAAQALQRDPIKFAADLTASIDQMVAAGKLTRPEAAAAKAQVDAAAAAQGAAPDDLLTPEGRELVEVRRQLAELSGTVQGDLTARQQVQQEAEAQQYGDAFFAEIDTQFNAANLAGASVATRVAVARYADGLLDADATGSLTEKRAIEAAIVKLREASAELTPQATAPAAVVAPGAPLPVGGGSAALPVAPVGKFATEADREAAMLAEAARVLAE